MTIQPPINPPSYNQEQLEDDFNANQTILNQVEAIKELAEEILKDWKDPSFKPERKECLEAIKTALEYTMDEDA